MLSDEEKQVVDYLIFHKYENSSKKEDMIDKVIEIIEKQSKEIEHQIEKRANQRNELAILNAKQVEFNKLVNTVNSYKGQFKRQQKEIEELKEDNKHQWEERCKLTFELENSTSNDKIKAKIEEVSNGTFDAKIVLQSLLEKE